MQPNRYPFVNPPLPYDAAALEPYLDAQTMRLHHDKHLQGYVDKLNRALAGHPHLQGLTLEQLLTHADRLPEPLATEVRRNAGGVYSHVLYFEGMAPPGQGGQPTGLFEQAIVSRFGGLAPLTAALSRLASEVFGSGYAWLVLHGGALCLTTTANQDTPLPHGMTPLLTVDVWEHAYYLKHHNRRGDYLESWKQVVNWNAAARRYDAAPGRGEDLM